MGMTGHLRPITASQLQRLLGDGRLVYELIAPVYGDAPEALTTRFEGALGERLAQIEDPEERRGFEEQMRRTMSALSSFNAKLQSAGAGKPLGGTSVDELRPELDLHKNWDALRYLLGEGAPKAILGGAAIGEDLGYGPARYLTPEEVAALAESLSSIEATALRSRFSLAAMLAADVYCPPQDEEELEELLDLFERLRRCYQAAAKRGDAMLLWLD